MKDFALVRVQPRHQVTLPKQMREELCLDAGAMLSFEKLPDGSWRIERQPRTLLDLLDEIRVDSPGVTTIEEIRSGWYDAERGDPPPG